ncbi:hypothetical protein AAC387_Pa02g2755 [Persea americana]
MGGDRVNDAFEEELLDYEEEEDKSPDSVEAKGVGNELFSQSQFLEKYLIWASCCTCFMPHKEISLADLS